MTGGYVIFPRFIIDELLTAELGTNKLVPGSYAAISQLAELNKPIVFDRTNNITFTPAFSSPITLQNGAYTLTMLLLSVDSFVGFLRVTVNSNDICNISQVTK